MTLARNIGGWCRGLDGDWNDMRRIPAVVERARTRGASGAMFGWSRRVATPVIATPRRAAEELRPLAWVVDLAVPQEELETVQKYQRVTSALLSPLDLGNALECVGIALQPESWVTMRSWLPRVEVNRNELVAVYWWTAAFAALALDEPLRYRKAAALISEPDNPFQPGAKFQFHLQGLLRHLGAALEAGAAFEDVRVAWEGFLLCYDYMADAASVDEGTLLWIARIVFHRIGGRPLGEVAQALHDSAWTLAGFTPGDLETPVTNLLAIIAAEKAARSTP